MQINVEKLSPNAKIPERATPGAAGYDLFAAQAMVIPARGRARIFTDIKVSEQSSNDYIWKKSKENKQEIYLIISISA